MTPLNAFAHVLERLWQRYNLVLTPREYDQLCQDIKALVATLPEQPPTTARLIVVYPFKGQDVRWAFSVESGVVVTALPKRDRPRKRNKPHQGNKRRKRLEHHPYRRPTQPRWDEEED